jgi:M6 family metalloprotease-like protein
MLRLVVVGILTTVLAGLAPTTFSASLPDAHRERGLETARHVRIDGMLQEDILVASGLESARGALDAVSCPSAMGEQRALVMLVNFLDEPTEPYTRAEISEIVMNAANPDSANAYIQEVSYGKAWLSGDVVDWITLPINAEDCGSYFETATLGNLLDLLDSSIDVTSYARFLIVHAAKPSRPCWPGSASTVGPVPISTSQGQVCASLLKAAVDQVSALATTHTRTIIHEFGHSLGVLHALDMECGAQSVPGFCTFSNPGRDRYDILGQTGLRGHYNGVFKERFGWVGPDQIETVTARPAQVVLDPIELPTDGTHVLKVPAVYALDGLGSSAHYFVTYRQAIGTDSMYTELQDPTTGVMLRLDVSDAGGPLQSSLVDSSPHITSQTLSQFDDSMDVVLSIGEAYNDARHGFSIRFADVVDGNAVVTVEDYVAPEPIPTMTERGLLVMALFLLAAAAVVLRRRVAGRHS